MSESVPSLNGGRIRQRAAFLHIAKCAGTSVSEALLAVSGSPPQPSVIFDTCYVAGLETTTELSDLDPHARSVVAWADDPPEPGRYLFHQHWSLPTILRWFDPPDVATVLREPVMRLLSYFEYIRAVPLSAHRLWLPETIGLDLVKSPLAEAITLPIGSRATDNLIARQVLWGDSRIPVGAMIAREHVDALAAAAIERLSSLGAVAVVEQDGGPWAVLSAWLGAPLERIEANQTPTRPTPGLFRGVRSPDEAWDVLQPRVAVDLQIWAYFAGKAGVDDPLARARTAALRRLEGMFSRSRGAVFHEWPTAGVAEATPHSAATARRLVLCVDTVPSEVPAADEIHLAQWDSTPPTRPPTGTTLLVEREPSAEISIRDALAGHEYAEVWVGRTVSSTLPDVVDSLGDLLRHDSRLVCHVPRRHRRRAAAQLATRGWQATSSRGHMVFHYAGTECSSPGAPRAALLAIARRVARRLRSAAHRLAR